MTQPERLPPIMKHSMKSFVNNAASIITAVIGMTFCTPASAYFNSTYGYPSPQWDRWLGQASYWWDNGPQGWTLARMNSGSTIFINYEKSHIEYGSCTRDNTDSGTASFAYKLVEQYVDGSTYRDGRSQIVVVFGGWTCTGQVWDNSSCN